MKFKTYVLFGFFTLFQIFFSSLMATELVVRLLALGEDAPDIARVKVAGVKEFNDYKGLSLMFEQRDIENQGYRYDSQVVGAQRRSGHEIGQSYRWAAQVVFSPIDTQAKVFVPVSSQTPKLKIYYEDKRNVGNGGQSNFNRNAYRSMRSENAGGPEFHFELMKKCIFEWTLPNGIPGNNNNPRSLEALASYLNDDNKPFRQSHPDYDTRYRNCITFSVAVLDDLGLLNLAPSGRSTTLPSITTVGGGLAVLGGAAAIGAGLWLGPAAPAYYIALYSGGGAFFGGAVTTAAGAKWYSKNVEKGEYILEEILQAYSGQVLPGPSPRILRVNIAGPHRNQLKISNQGIAQDGGADLLNGLDLFVNRYPSLRQNHQRFLQRNNGVTNVNIHVQ